MTITNHRQVEILQSECDKHTQTIADLIQETSTNKIVINSQKGKITELTKKLSYTENNWNAAHKHNIELSRSIAYLTARSDGWRFIAISATVVLSLTLVTLIFGG